jgi:hypothetical protein
VVTVLDNIFDVSEWSAEFVDCFKDVDDDGLGGVVVDKVSVVSIDTLGEDGVADSCETSVDDAGTVFPEVFLKEEERLSEVATADVELVATCGTVDGNEVTTGAVVDVFADSDSSSPLELVDAGDLAVDVCTGDDAIGTIVISSLTFTTSVAESCLGLYLRIRILSSNWIRKTYSFRNPSKPERRNGPAVTQAEKIANLKMICTGFIVQSEPGP